MISFLLLLTRLLFLSLVHCAAVDLQKDRADAFIRGALVLHLNKRQDVLQVLGTITSYEQRFNRRYNYDWVIVTTRSIDTSYREAMVNCVGPGTAVRFIELKYQRPFVGYPGQIDRTKARNARKQLKLPKSRALVNPILARHFTRFFTGNFYNLDNLWNNYDYYWKVPLDSRLQCDVTFDVFKFMQRRGIKYGWLSMEQDLQMLHPTLMTHVKSYFDLKEDDTRLQLLFPFGDQSCNFNPDSELVDVSFFRSQAYQDFFNYIDALNGFYYETWRESHIKTIATSLLLDSKEIHYFDNLAVETAALSNCPKNATLYADRRCNCDPTKGRQPLGDSNLEPQFTPMSESSCLKSWLRSQGLSTPTTHDDTENANFFEVFLT